MNVVILAGGLGTRLAEETEIKPKPMVEVGSRPLLWHILKHYAHHGFLDFFVALGYRGDVIKRYFADYASLSGSIRVDVASSNVVPYDASSDRWQVHLMETGAETSTGGRVGKLRPFLGREPFMLTYGDGVCDVDLGALLAFHRSHGKIATMTAVRPPSRFGAIDFDGDRICGFMEKPQTGEGWINGGYMVFEPALFDFIDGDSSSLEADALERIANQGQLMGFRHEGFWQCMDTVRDKRYLESLWQSGSAPWKVWR
jgi:glucose-1-phosphate cytidylyltransferase